MSDLASQPETSETPLTLAERRANYESWLQSGRRAAMPAHTTRVDDLPSKLNIRALAEVGSADKLLNEVPPGTIVRTDEGEGTEDASEDVRLKLAGALVAKMDTADAETATRMANAGNALLAPLKARADDAKADDDKPADDENVKNHVLNQGKGGVAGADDKGAADAAPTLAAILDTLGKITGRLDAIEAKGKDSEHTSTPPNKDKKEVADDDSVRDDGFKWRQKQDKLGTVICSPDTQDAFAVIQARADKVYSANGQQADKPLYGETLRRIPPATTQASAEVLRHL